MITSYSGFYMSARHAEDQGSTPCVIIQELKNNTLKIVWEPIKEVYSIDDTNELVELLLEDNGDDLDSIGVKTKYVAC